MSIKPLSFTKMTPVPIAKRKVENDGVDFAAPYLAGSGFANFLCSLPNLGCAANLFHLRDAIVSAHRHKHQVILACGGQVVESGLGPLICRLIEQRIITGLALTGEAMQQDVEIAILGQTVSPGDRELSDGRFCLTEESCSLINDAINFGASENWGIGKSVGKRLLDSELEHLDYSIIATAERYGLPVSVHPAIGADAFGMHPAAHGESLGAASFRDFRLLAGMLAESSHGVIVNIASNVVMPRVLLQALDAARNVGKTIEGITTAIIDPAASSAARTDVIERLTKPDGVGYWLSGPDEILLPLLFASVLEALADEIG